MFATKVANNTNSDSKSSSLVSISQAANVLGVSIDTVRRWDRSGIINSTRPDGKNRFFSIDELERVKLNKPLTISEAARMLKISASTLRRLEKKGLVSPLRNGHNERLYDRKTLESFLNSEYFIRQKEVEEEVLEPLRATTLEEAIKTPIKEKEPAEKQPGKGLALRQLISEHNINIERLRKKSWFSFGALGIILAPVATVIFGLAVAFLINPISTAKSFNLLTSVNQPPKISSISESSVAGTSVLAANTEKAVYTGTPSWKDNLRPLVNMSLFVVNLVDSHKYAIATQDLKFADVNAVFQPNQAGEIQSVYTLSLDSSKLSITDQGLVLNLNSELLQGKRPGSSAGDIAVLPLSGGQGGDITDGSITTFDIANGAITSDKLASGLKLNADKITTTSSLTIDNGLTLTTGAFNLAATSGALNLSGLSASSIDTGTNALIITSSNFNTTATGINSTAIGVTTASTGAFTTISATGQIISTLANGTAPLVIASSTNVANLNASSLNGFTFAAPGAIGSGTAGTGAFTTLSASSLAIASITNSSLTTAGVVTNTAAGVLGTLAGTSTTVLHGNVAGLPTFSSVVGGDLATNIVISTSGNIATTGAGTTTSAGLLTASNGLTLTTGVLNLTATSGTLALSGLSASSINSGANGLTVTSSNFNTTTTGINSTAIGATTASTGAFSTISASGQITSTVTTGTAPLVIASTTNVANLNASSLNGATFAAPGAIGGGTASTGAFTTLSSAGATNLATTGASNVTIATTGTGTVAIGNATGSFALTSAGGLNVSTAGALTGVTSLDTIATTATGLTFAGAGTVAATGTNALNFTAGASSAWNIGANALTITSSNFNTTATGINSTAIGATTASTGAFTTLSSTGLSVTSTNTTGLTTSSAISLSANSLTTGTGIYAASSSLTSGLLVDLQVSGTAAAASQTGLNILTTGATATNAITTYGAQISNTHTNATSGTNVALYLNASGATTANYGLIVNAGNVGVGTNAPVAPLHIVKSSTIFSATGGTITTSGAYTIHTFTTTGTFTPNGSYDTEVLVVGGGGGGGDGTGAYNTGGGGAGGVVYDSIHAVTAQAYTVTVGDGGAHNTNGSNSVFDDITAIGGGHAATTGGSGGGNGGAATQGASGGEVGYGHSGGAGGSNGGGGGGGAGAAGQGNQGNGLGGVGGDGIINPISGSTAGVLSGGNYYIAGGGGGNGSGNIPAGGLGGGGTGRIPTAGTANTGGGGGGYYGSGGAGGSGVVVIRYLTPSEAFTEEQRLGFDTSNYSKIQVGSNGSLKISAIGTNPNITLTPGGTGAMIITSGVTTGTTTTSGLSLSANSLTTGTGLYAASSSLTSGLLADLQVSGTAAAASQTALNILTTGANGTAGITTYGAQISNTHSTNTSTNVALYLNASGGATANYGLIVNAGNVGIGTTTPTTALDVAGLTLNTDATNSVASANFAGTITKNDANTITFNGVQIKPILNTGASNTTTTLNVLNIDTTNTAVTGLTTNLISASYGAATKFTLASTGNIVQTSGAAGTTGYSLGLAGFTSGKGLQIFSSSNAVTSGNLLDVGTTGTTGSVAFTGDIAKFSDVRTFTSGVGLSSTGHALDVSRAITLNNVGNTHTISGALVTFSDSSTQTAGTLTNTANVLSLTQSYTSASGAVLAISNSGSGVDVLGTSSTWQVTKAGAATFGGTITAQTADSVLQFSATTATEKICGTQTDATASAGIIRDCTGTPGDYAEEYGSSDPTIEAGDVVALDPTRPAQEYIGKDGFKGSKAWVIKASKIQASGLIGIVSTQPNDVIGKNFDTSDNPRPIALSGRLPAKVSTENGPIAVGDYLTSSSVPGVAMKAAKNDPVVGIAEAPYSDATVGKIIAYLHLSYYYGGIVADNAVLNSISPASGVDVSLVLGADGRFVIKNAAGQEAVSFNSAGSANFIGMLSAGGGLTVNGLAQFNGQSIFDKLVTFNDAVDFTGDVNFGSTATFNSDAGGFAVIHANQQEVKVKFDKSYPQIPVVTVNISDGQFAAYSYKDLTAEGFTIVLKEPAATNLDFAWTALSIKDAVTTGAQD